ncbi:MAG: aspartyl protease family protein, partial [Asticcacaulis sp.]|nr:aspartyl protease family protein [Asticcacaulis sp.]
LGLVRGEEVLVDGLARQIPAETVTLAELAFGPFKHKDLLIPVLPRTLLGCDGYLGLDVINNTRVTFDFAHNILRVDTGRGELDRDPGYLLTHRHDSTKVNMSGSQGRMRASDCWVDSIRTTAFIDTGAEVSVGNLPLINALKRRKVPPPELGRIVLIGVTGGQAVGEIIPIRGIRLQELNFSNGTLAIADIPNFATWGLADRPALLIGMDFLRQFGRVSIDFRSREIRFELAGGIPAQPPVPALIGGEAAPGAYG